jgi:O-antigen/teichoic acid export membrane protein
LIVLFRRTVRDIVPAPRGPVLRELRPLVAASAPFMAVTLAVMTYRQIDVIVISRIAGDRDVGWYAAADLLAGSLLFPTTIIMSTVFPTFGRLHVHDPGQLRTLVRRTYSLLFLVAVPIGFGAAVVGPTFGPLLFGDDYGGTGEALVVLGPVTILSFATTMLAYLALATERTKFLAWLIAASAVATIPLDMMLVPWAADRYDNGAIGGALAYVVTESLQFVIALLVVAPYLITRDWAWRSVRVLLAGGIMVAATWPFRHQIFLVPATIGAVVYPLAAFALRVVDADQREMLADAIGRVGVPTGWVRP